MSTLLIILFLGMGAAIGYGIADFFGARASKHLGPLTSVFCVQAVGTLVFCLWYLLFVHTMPVLSPEVLGMVIGGSLFLAAGMCTLYMAFEIGPVSLVSPIGAAYPLFVTLIGIFLFHAHISFGQIIGIGLVVFGVMAASGLFNLKKSMQKLGRGPLLAIVTTILWGMAFPLVDHAVSSAGWLFVTLVQVIVMAIFMMLVLFFQREKERISLGLLTETLSNKFVIGAGILQMLAGVAINLGFLYDQAAGSFIVTISSAYPVITVLLALRHFDERVNKLALTGAITSIVGVILVLSL